MQHTVLQQGNNSYLMQSSFTKWGLWDKPWDEKHNQMNAAGQKVQTTADLKTNQHTNKI